LPGITVERIVGAIRAQSGGAERRMQCSCDNFGRAFALNAALTLPAGNSTRRSGRRKGGITMLGTTNKRDLKVTEPFWKSSETPPVADPLPRQPETAPQPQVQSLGRGEEIDARTMIVGPGMSVSGSITSCNRLIAEGTVDAKLDGCEQLIVTKTGIFRGNVTTDNADVHGQVEGDLVVRKRLLVRATGRVSGTISYGDIEIECGAKISGQFKPGEGGNAVADAKPAQASHDDPTTRSAPLAKLPQSVEPAGAVPFAMALE
jgi:cytoskeletal protein CcmA (bactofilin family)